MQAGITHFDSSVAGLGGCPYAPGASGNIATEDLVDTMNEMDIETGIDIDRLLDTARFVREALGHSDSATLRAGKISDLSVEGPHPPVQPLRRRKERLCKPGNRFFARSKTISC